MADNDPFAGLPPPAQAQALFTNPEFLQGAAMIAAKNRDPSMMKWLEQAHLAAREGAIEAVGHLAAKNPQEAVNVWNRTGQYRDVINVHDNNDGTYTVTRKGGIKMTLDPIKEYKRLLSPREFVAAQQHEAELADRQKRYQLEDRRHTETLAETRRYHDAVIGGQAEERANRLAIAEGNAVLRGFGGGSRASGTGGAGGDGGGGDGSYSPVKPEKLLEQYKDAFAEATKEKETDANINANERAWTKYMQRTAGAYYDKRTKQWVVATPNPSTGKLSPYAEYDTEAEASAALANLRDQASRPHRPKLMRQYAAEWAGPASEEATAAARPPEAGPPQPTAAPQQPRQRYLPTVDEARAKIEANKAASTAKGRVKQSPEYQALYEQRKKAIMNNDIKTIDALSAQMRALLEAAK